MNGFRLDRDLRSVRWSRVAMTVTALVVVTMGAAALWASSGLGWGELSQPGPGFWPAALGSALVVLGLCMLVFQRRLSAEPFTGTSWRVLAGVGAVMAFVELFAAVGPTLPTFLFMLVWLRWLSGRSWPSSIAISLATAGALYAIFVLALDISFPHDPLLPTT